MHESHVRIASATIYNKTIITRLRLITLTWPWSTMDVLKNSLSNNCALYTCNRFHFVDDMEALGMESGAIADSRITASSEFNVYHSAKQARLYTRETYNARGAWVSLTTDFDQWLQVDLGKTTPVTHVATQGRNSYSQMVTTYKLQFSDDGASFMFYKREGESTDAVNGDIIIR